MAVPARSFRGQKVLQPGHPDALFSSKKSRQPFLVVSLKTPAANAIKIKQIKRSNVITLLYSVHTITEAKQYAVQSQCLSQGLSQGGGSSSQVIWPGVPCCSTTTDLVAAAWAWNSLWESYSVCIIIIVIHLCGDYFEVLFDWQEVCCVEFHPVHQILSSGSRDFSVKFYEYSKPSVKKAYKSIQVLEWTAQLHSWNVKKCMQKYKGKGKAEHLYSALHGIQTTLKRSGMDHTVLPAINTTPAFTA